METIGNWLTAAIEAVNGWVWSPALVGLCLLAGLYFSLRTRFVQVRRFGEMFRLLFGVTDKRNKSARTPGKTGISSFQAFAMALSGRVGTGNIVGVATAIGFGVALTVFAGMREQLELVKVPKGMQGMAIVMLSAGLLSLAFMGFSGVDGGLKTLFGLE